MTARAVCCAEIRRTLKDYLRDVVGAESGERILAHTHQCDTCRLLFQSALGALNGITGHDD